mgnify:CR=1 FL=1
MAKIIPFKAVRPTRKKVHLVSSRPFYTYKKSHLKAKLESNPYSFLHVINPEFNRVKKNIIIDAGFVTRQLMDIVEDQDLSRYIL